MGQTFRQRGVVYGGCDWKEYLFDSPPTGGTSVISRILGIGGYGLHIPNLSGDQRGFIISTLPNAPDRRSRNSSSVNFMRL